jgi:hypothetical protein
MALRGLLRDGVLDGALTDEPADGPPESAQTAMRHWVQDTFQ